MHIRLLQMYQGPAVKSKSIHSNSESSGLSVHPLISVRHCAVYGVGLPPASHRAGCALAAFYSGRAMRCCQAVQVLRAAHLINSLDDGLCTARRVALSAKAPEAFSALPIPANSAWHVRVVGRVFLAGPPLKRWQLAMGGPCRGAWAWLAWAALRQRPRHGGA